MRPVSGGLAGKERERFMSDEQNKITAELDCQGMACPMPVIMTKKALEQRPEVLNVLVDNTAAKENVTKFATANGYGVSIEQEGDLFRLRLTAAAGAASPPARAQEDGPVFSSAATRWGLAMTNWARPDEVVFCVAAGTGRLCRRPSCC